MIKLVRKALNNKQGIALPGLFLGVVIFVIFTAMIGQQIIESRHENRESEIATNKSQLEQSERSYLLSRGRYATDTAKLLKDYPLLTAQHNFQKVLREKFNMAEEEVNARIQVVNISEMKNDSFFNGEISNPTFYVIDTVTGKVYHLRDKATLSELEELAKELLKDSDDVIELTVKDGDVFDLTVGGKNMDRVIASVHDGNKIILGGGKSGTGDIKLLLVDLSINAEEGNDKKLVDLTKRVAGGNLQTPITAVRLINPGVVLAHYYHDNELKYELIQY